MAGDSSAFATLGYRRINSRRLEHLASLGLNLVGRSILELGAGVGDHTTFFLDRDCTVLSVEARPENCQQFIATMKSMHAGGYVQALKWSLKHGDVNRLDQFSLNPFEVVYAYGILYHLSDPERALKLYADFCTDMLLLETCVAVGEYDDFNLTPEQSSESTQSIEGMGCRPTRPWIFKELSKHFAHVYVPKTQPAHELFPIDWTVPPKQNMTRAVFVASRRPLNQDTLSATLINKQVY
jgi:hypothetical protein